MWNETGYARGNGPVNSLAPTCEGKGSALRSRPCCGIGWDRGRWGRSSLSNAFSQLVSALQPGEFLSHSHLGALFAHGTPSTLEARPFPTLFRQGTHGGRTAEGDGAGKMSGAEKA